MNDLVPAVNTGNPLKHAMHMTQSHNHVHVLYRPLHGLRDMCHLFMNKELVTSQAANDLSYIHSLVHAFTSLQRPVLTRRNNMAYYNY